MSQVGTSLDMKSVVHSKKIEYTREVLESAFLPFASTFNQAIQNVLIFDVRDKVGGTASNGLALDNFIFPVKTSETLVAELYQPDGSKKTRRLPKKLRRLPTEILYDAVGLDLFDQITYLEDEYYLTACEKEILQTKGTEICSKIPDGASIIELGCGSMTKTAVIIDHLRALKKKGIKFYALDLEEESLRNSIVSLMASELEQRVPEEYKIQYGGILGTYDQAMASFLKDLQGPKVFLWLGSSIGNYERPEAEAFLKKIQKEVMNKDDLFFIGIDNRNDPITLARAYNDRDGITMSFVENGLVHLNQLLGQDLFKSDCFDVLAGYNNFDGRNEVYYRSLIDQAIAISSKKTSKLEHVLLHQNELIRIEVSVKYSLSEIETLAMNSGLALKDRWMDSKNMYHFCLVQKAEDEGSLAQEGVNYGYLVSKAPTLLDWEDTWRNWDRVSSPDLILDLSDQPIGLRHPFIFYIGHIPCFCDILLSHCLGEALLDPQDYQRIFERGIDPIVEDPSQCHGHSEVPEEWPQVEDILDYKARVRTRVKEIYKCLKSGDLKTSRRRLERVLHLALEHEIMHTETFLCMMLQSKKIKFLTPKPEFLSKPSGELKPAHWIEVPAGIARIGIDDDENEDFAKVQALDRSFGWDNESPERRISVNAFQIQNRPISVQEYMEFLTSLDEFDSHLIPASFEQISNGVEKFALKSFYGLIPISHCSDLPIMLSYTQAEAYKDYLMDLTGEQNLMIPTEAQLVRFYQQNWNLDESVNVGFQNFCSLPMIEDAVHVIGSVWEWTSTVFEEHNGFKTSVVYPGYSNDLFDGLHNVVVGASWATQARLVGRLRNFYQRSYPYAFVGVRFAKSND